MTSKAKKKVFTGSKPGSFYGEGYYLRGEGSNYGSRDQAGKLLFAPYDEASYLPRNRQLAKFIVDVYKPQSALVLGCARAYLVMALHELGVDCQGIDISEWAISNAPEKLQGHLHIGDICDLSRFQTGEFDCVVGLDVFEHIHAPDLYTAIEEAKRVCKETLIVDVPLGKDDLHPDQSSGSDKSHVSVYSETFWTQHFTSLDYFLDGKEVYSYPDQSQGGTFVFRRHSQLSSSKTTATDLKDHPRVDIIILNYNGLKFTSKCLETLYKNTDYTVEEEVITKNGVEKRVELGFNVIVVDNQSVDGSADYLQFAMQSYPNMKVMFLKELNSGFAQGVNVGLKEASAPLVLLLNNDTLFTQRNWLKQLVEALQKDSSVGIASPKLLYPDGRIQYAGASFNGDVQPYHFGRFKNAEAYSTPRLLPWATFACVLIRRELLTDGLDENYKLGTFEDVDFCCRARFNGYKISYVPSSVLYHYEGASIFTLNQTHYRQQQLANANRFYSRWRTWLTMNRNTDPEVYQP